jgi:hypothetical protein
MEPLPRRRISSLVAAAVLALALRGVPATAQPEGDRERSTATLENGQAEAALYSIRAEGSKTSIPLHEEPVLKWNNSVNQSVFGNIFLWTKAGRPEVVASIYQFYSPKKEFAAEFQSLSLDPLVIEKNGKEVWAPKEPGVVFKAFEGAGEPSASKSQRLVAMKKLAGEFTVELTDWLSQESYHLRLLPTPLYRYGSPDSDVLDGALFAFTYTTDPELLVMVEARRIKEGHRWMYGHARMNVGELKVSYRDREIWNAERLEHPFLYKEGVYTLFMDLPLPKRGAGK